MLSRTAKTVMKATPLFRDPEKGGLRLASDSSNADVLNAPLSDHW